RRGRIVRAEPDAEDTHRSEGEGSRQGALDQGGGTGPRDGLTESSNRSEHGRWAHRSRRLAAYGLGTAPPRRADAGGGNAPCLTGTMRTGTGEEDVGASTGWASDSEPARTRVTPSERYDRVSSPSSYLQGAISAPLRTSFTRSSGSSASSRMSSTASLRVRLRGTRDSPGRITPGSPRSQR